MIFLYLIIFFNSFFILLGLCYNTTNVKNMHLHQLAHFQIEADQLTPVADVEQMQIACKALNGRLQVKLRIIQERTYFFA